MSRSQQHTAHRATAYAAPHATRRGRPGLTCIRLTCLGLMCLSLALLPLTAMAEPPAKPPSKDGQNSRSGQDVKRNKGSRSERIRALMQRRNKPPTAKATDAKNKRMGGDRTPAAQADRSALLRQVKTTRHNRREAARKGQHQVVERVKGERSKRKAGERGKRLSGHASRPTKKRAAKKSLSAAAGKKPRRRCALVQQEVPRGGRIEVNLPSVGRAPVVRIGGRVARLLSRRRTRIAVQVPGNSDGGPVTVQDGGDEIACGRLRIIGLN